MRKAPTRRRESGGVDLEADRCMRLVDAPALSGRCPERAATAEQRKHQSCQQTTMTFLRFFVLPWLFVRARPFPRNCYPRLQARLEPVRSALPVCRHVSDREICVEAALPDALASIATLCVRNLEAAFPCWTCEFPSAISGHGILHRDRLNASACRPDS